MKEFWKEKKNQTNHTIPEDSLGEEKKVSA